MLYHIRTPLMPSPALTRIANKPIFLKLENLQMSGSFKDRGLGHFCDKAAQRGAQQFVVSPGSNSSLAVAHTARALGVPVHAILPPTVSSFALKRLLDMGVTTTLHGHTWGETQDFARDWANKHDGMYVPSYDHPEIWEGHSSIVDEIVAAGICPGVIVLAVSGGGLLCGIIQGLQKAGWGNVPIVTAELSGTASLHASMKAFDVIDVMHPTRLNVYFMGTSKVAQQALDSALEHGVTSAVVDEDDAIAACCRFADDHHMIVEPITGAALSLVYKDGHVLKEYESVLVVVCGGNNISPEQLAHMRQRV